MRRFFLIICTIVLSLSVRANDTTAVQPEVFRHYIDIHAAGGVSRLEYALQGGTNSITPAFSVGLGYTYFFHRSVGLQLGLHFTRVASDARMTTPLAWNNLTDYQGDTYDHHLTFNGWKERQQSYLLEVPLGLRFRYRKDGSRAGLHAAFGAKLAIPMLSNYSTSGSVTNTAWYEQWKLELNDLPGRFETETFDPKQHHDLDQRLMKWNAEVYGELGLSVRLNVRADLLIAAYGQYMCTNFSSPPADQRTALGFASSANNAYAFMPAYTGLIGTDRIGVIRPWMAGLKLGLSIYPGPTRAQRERQLKKLAGEFPELVPLRHDTLWLYDTIRLHDTVILEKRIIERVPVETTKTVVERPTAEEKRLAALLSQAVIWFRFDEYKPILEPAYILDSVAAMMLRYPELVIHVNGHACRIGSDGYNQRLAMRRAQAVANLLQQKGIHTDRMRVVSYGASHPYRYNTQRQLARDRRVEVVPEGYELQPEDARLTAINAQPSTLHTALADRQNSQHSTFDQYTSFIGEEHVRPGSRLAQIARRWYGEPEYWVYIYEANADKIADPQRVTPGLLVMIPDLKHTLHKDMSKREALQDARTRAKQYK